VAGLALAPYVQVRFDKEEFEKRSEKFYEEKLLPELVMAAAKPIVPVELKRTYPKKTGSMYSKAHYDLEKRHEDELMDLLVERVQTEQKAKKQTVQSREEIIANFEKLAEVKKRSIINSLLKQNPEVAKRQTRETKQEEKQTIDKNIIRQRRKKQAKKQKRERSLTKQPKQRNEELKKDRVQRKDPRIAARPTNEKPVEVKHISPAVKQAELAPTAVKEEKKGISARLMKVEQLTGKKDAPKGISAALAAAEQQKVQEAKERVVAESKGKFNPADRVMKPLNPEQESRIETLVKGKETKSPEFWRQAAARKQYKEAV